MNNPINIISCHLDTPCGRLYISASQLGICHVGWTPLTNSCDGKSPLLEEAYRQLDEYFKGQRKSFDIPLDLHGTAFQLRCWKALASIPYATTINYAQQAEIIGLPKATRAVGQANNRNPIAIILPCHRVIGKNGKLTGYNGGTDIKRQLLELEQRHRKELKDEMVN